MKVIMKVKFLLFLLIQPLVQAAQADLQSSNVDTLYKLCKKQIAQELAAHPDGYIGQQLMSITGEPLGPIQEILHEFVGGALKKKLGIASYLLGRHDEWIKSIAFNDDDSLIASGSIDQTVRLWDVLNPRNSKVFDFYNGGVSSVAFCGTKLIAGSYDRTVKICDLAAPEQDKEIKYNISVDSVACNPEGAQIAVCLRSAVHLLDSDGDSRQLIEGWCPSTRFSDDGKKIIVFNNEGPPARTFDLESHERSVVRLPESHLVRGSAVNNNGTKMLLRITHGRGLVLWDLVNQRQIKLGNVPWLDSDHGGPMTFNHHSTQVAISHQKKLFLYNLGSSQKVYKRWWEQKRPDYVFDGYPNVMTYNHVGDKIAVGFSNREIHLCVLDYHPDVEKLSQQELSLLTRAAAHWHKNKTYELCMRELSLYYRMIKKMPYLYDKRLFSYPKKQFASVGLAMLASTLFGSLYFI
jgi:WD40 repeat protein